jgi:hypothetical protein
MIKPSEAVVLTGLRKTTLAYLSDSDFKEVEKAVEQDGILSLKGYVAEIVKDAVVKHGSHNQSSHGKGGGKGGGGANGGGSSSASGTQDKIGQAKEELGNNIVGAQRVLDNAKNADDANMARGAVKGFKEVQGALGDKKAISKIRTKRNALAGQLMSPQAAMQSGYRENYGYVRATTSALAIYGNL